jgi:magnesium transporter
MVTVFVREHGQTRLADRVERRWLDASSGIMLWVDLAAPTPDEGKEILSDTFKFHPLAIEDALSEIHIPKIEAYQGYLYLILHGIDFKASEHRFATRDVDFFLGPNYLVTVHDGKSRSIANMRTICEKHDHVLAEGPVGVLHRIVHSMVDNYRPEIEQLGRRMDQMEDEAILGNRTDLVRAILRLKRDLASLRGVVVPQRDAVGRLARREFSLIDDEMAYRFRDVYDQLVRLYDEATLFQDRVTGILEAHLSTVSNRLNQVMKVLTVMSTIFLPLTVLTGMYGMNVPLPHLPGGEHVQFWWIMLIMLGVSGVMLWFFRRRGWV